MKRKNSILQSGLYVHIPFCRSKCPYCAFYSIASQSLIPRWVEALKSECRLVSGSLKDRFQSFNTIHFGGGTPSILDPGILERIMKCLLAHFSFSGLCEVAMEANPLDLTAERVSAIRSLGFTRVVVGAQSFSEKSLAFLGRKHSGRDVRNAMEVLRREGFQNTGIDLIYGIQGQTIEEWTADLEKAVAFSPAHISCYCLSLEDGTRFGRMAHKGDLATLSSEKEREFFLAASDFLGRRGYIHYEVSNFARGRQFESRHNLKYWRREPYLGLGPSAHSFDGTARWWNIRSIKGYCEALEKGSLPVDDREDLTAEQTALEKVAMGLRIREGFSLDEETRHWIRTDRIEAMEKEGLIVREGMNVAPTMNGFLVADRLPLELVV